MPFATTTAGPRWAATDRILMPVGKPAPPRPVSPAADDMPVADRRQLPVAAGVLVQAGRMVAVPPAGSQPGQHTRPAARGLTRRRGRHRGGPAIRRSGPLAGLRT